MITEHLLMMNTEGNTGVPHIEKAGRYGSTIHPAVPGSEEPRKCIDWDEISEAAYFLVYGEPSGECF